MVKSKPKASVGLFQRLFICVAGLVPAADGMQFFNDLSLSPQLLNRAIHHVADGAVWAGSACCEGLTDVSTVVGGL
jgi:hypothetical protein